MHAAALQKMRVLLASFPKEKGVENERANGLSSLWYLRLVPILGLFKEKHIYPLKGTHAYRKKLT